MLDALEDSDLITNGGNIIDWHACDLFPESWIDLVVVLRTDSTTLYDRLKARNYEEKKLQGNLDSEIWALLLEEAKEGFEEGIVVELKSEDADDMEANVGRIEQWIMEWRKQRENEGEGG